MSKTVSCLLVEDNPGDVGLIQRGLQEDVHRPVTVEVRGTLLAALEALEATEPEVILLDLNLPDSQGLETFLGMKAAAPSTPLIILSSEDNQALALECIDRGAHDFLVKGRGVERFIAGAIHNTVARAAAQRAAGHLNQVLRAIRCVNQVIVRQSDPDRLIDAVCQCLVSSRGYDAAWIAVAERPGIFGQIFAERGFGEAFEGVKQRLFGGESVPCCRPTPGPAEVHVVLDPRSQCPADCPSLETTASCCQQAATAMIAPLKSEGRGYGFICIAAPEGLKVDEAEKALVLETAGDIAYALRGMELERRQRRYAQIVASSTEAMALVDPGYTYLEANEAYRSLVGAAGGELIGRSLEELLGEAFFAHTIKPRVDRCLAGEESRFETTPRLAGATPRHLDALYTPCRDADGAVTAVAICMRDITEQRRAEQDRLAESQRAQQYLDIAGVILLAITPEGIVTMVNQQGCQVLGYPEAEIVGKNWFEHFIPPGAQDEVQAVARALLEDDPNAPAVYENAVLTRRGEQRLIAWNNTVVRDAAGGVIGTLSSGADITEQRRGEERSRFLGKVIEQTPDGIICTDAGFRITYINRATERLFGWTLAEVQGEGPHIFYTNPRKAEGALQDIYQRVRGGEVHDGEGTSRRKDGSTFTCQYRVAPIFDDGGQIVAYMGTQRDVTEHRALQARMAQSDRLASMGMLAAGVAHEINNPLAYMLYNLESLTDDLPRVMSALGASHAALGRLGQVDQEAVLGPHQELLNQSMLEDILERFQDALHGTLRIKEISRGLGTFSRVDEERQGPVDLAQVITAAINMVNNEIRYRARLVKDFGDVPPITANDGKLSQVFLNLLINATQAMDEGDVQNNEIRVRTWQEGPEVCAEVSDTGKGITREDMEHLFEPFFTTKELGQGTGLGLSISKNIIERHGGRMTVTSEVGRGTRVLVRLPVRSSQPADVARAPAAPDRAQGDRGRILLVDDEDSIRAALRRVLREHDVVEAAGGAQAMELLREGQDYDLILCDVMMPDVSGLDLHQWMAARWPRLAEQVIFITGGAFTPRAREYLAQVDNLRLDKPFDVEELQKIVGDRIGAARA